MIWSRWLHAPLQASAIGTSGDLVCQLAVEGKTLSRIDTRRSLSFSIFGFLYSGMFQRALYLRFDQIFGVGQDLRTVSLKVASDSLLHGPFLYIPTFCISTAVLQGSSSEEVWERLRSNWAPMVQAYLGIWPATMGLMFYAIPVPSRILYISTIAFAEKMVLSALSFRPSAPQLPADVSARDGHEGREGRAGIANSASNRKLRDVDSERPNASCDFAV